MAADKDTGSPPNKLPRAWQEKSDKSPKGKGAPKEKGKGAPKEKGKGASKEKGKGASKNRDTNDYYAVSTATTPLGMPIVKKNKDGKAGEDKDGKVTGGKQLPKRCPVCCELFPADFRVCPRDAVTLEEVAEGAKDALVGRVLGDCYRIVRRIGLGGTAKVFEARHTRLKNKRFAVKLLLPEFAVQPDIVKRFEREAEAASRIRHPNVVDVYDVHRTDDGKPYLVAEYLEGEELGDVLDKKGKLDPLHAVRIGIQVCDAIAAAHANGIVHRDMKPENVFLMGDPENPTAKVIDFGISHVAYETGAKKLTKTGMVMGTPSYMPPEQAMGKKIDHRTDVYGVGAILYRTLTGRRPFEENDAMSVLSAVIRSNPPRMRSVEPSIPEALELIIERAMAKEPDDRYPTIVALRADLEEFAQVHTAKTGIGSGPLKPATTGVGGRKIRDASLPPFMPHLVDSPGESTLAQAVREAKRARPVIVFLTALAFIWLLVGIIEVIHAFLRKIGFTYTRMEMWLGLGVLLAATLTPAVFWIRHLARGVWSHSNRALSMSYAMRRVVGVGVAAYGTILLLTRLLSVIKAPKPPGGLFNWSVLPFVVSLAAAGTALLTLWRNRRKSKQGRAAAARAASETTEPRKPERAQAAEPESAETTPAGSEGKAKADSLTEEPPPPPPSGKRKKKDD